MLNIVRIVGALAFIAQIVVCAPHPALALTVELAKKCRDMALKAHPPPIPPGNKAYASAEREFFGKCVSRNGNMDDADAPKKTAPNDATPKDGGSGSSKDSGTHQ